MRLKHTLKESTFFEKTVFYLLSFLIAALLFTSCESTEEPTEEENENPLASFTYNKNSDLAPAIVDFDATSSSDSDGSVVDFAWDFGDGETGAGDIASHLYATAGPFTVTLTVTDDMGATGSTTDTITFAEGIQWMYEADKPVYYSSPAVAADGTIYFGTGIFMHTDSGSLYALNPDGTLKWKRDLDPFENDVYPKGDNAYSPAIGPDGTIYIQGCTSALYAFDSDGNLLWKYEDFDSYPVGFEVGQRTPAIDLDGTLYVSADALYALYPDGILKWGVPLQGGNNWSSPALLDDGTLYIGSHQMTWEGEFIGHLFAIKTTSLGLAVSPWPKFRKNNRNTGRFGD